MKPLRTTAPPNHRTGWRWALLPAGLGVLVGLAVYAPATWLAWAVATSTQQRVLMPNATGTVWAGRADLVLSSGRARSGAAALPQGITWQWRPSWTAQGPAAALQLTAPCCTPDGMPVTLGWQAGPIVTLPAHRSTWPTTWLSGLGAPWNTLQLGGQLRLETADLNLRWAQGEPRLSGPLDVIAQDLSTRLSTLRPLGSYKVTLAPDTAGATTLRLSTLKGALKLSGDGQWLQGRLRFRGVAEADPASVDALSNLLNILGRREGTRAHMSLG